MSRFWDEAFIELETLFIKSGPSVQPTVFVKSVALELLVNDLSSLWLSVGSREGVETD